MRRLLLALITAASVWTAPTAQARDAGECLQLFLQYDRVSGRYPGGGVGRGWNNLVLPGDLARATQRVVAAGCQTWTRDLDGMEAYAATLQGFRITDGPTAIRPTPVHLGALTSIADEVRVTIVFRGLGYNSRGLGARELGRRIYIGPFYSQEALDQAISLGREVGFVAPYAATQTRF
jgi:hypothetical protein